MATDYPVSLVKGATVADRAVINAAAAANSAPTTAQQSMVPVGMNASIDVVLKETGGGTFDAKVWWYYPEADTWVEDLAVGTIAVAANSTSGAVLTLGAASNIYIEVLNFAGGARASAWLIGRNGRHA